MGGGDSSRSFPSGDRSDSCSRGRRDRRLGTGHPFWSGWRILRGGLDRHMFPMWVFGGFCSSVEGVSIYVYYAALVLFAPVFTDWTRGSWI